MSREKLKELLRKRSMKVGSVVLAAALVFGGGMWATREPEVIIPELVTFVDPIETAVIEDEETPLASPQVTTKTTTKTKKKKIKLKKKSKKTYTKKGKTTTKKKTSTKISGNTTTKTDTVTVTSIQDKFKKNSKTKTRITTTKTTVTTTKTTKNAVAAASRSTAASTSAAAPRTQASAFITARNQPFTWSKVDQVSPMIGNAFLQVLKRTIEVNPNAGFDGKYDVKGTGNIIVRAKNGTVYHELGHFLAFVVGNYDTSQEFIAIYNREKGSYKEYNADYVCQNSSEYFAEAFCQYVLDRNGLQQSRPQTCRAVETALSKLTDTQINGVKNVYGHLWGLK